MEILDLRLLRPQDLESLLQEEIQVWQDRLHWDYASTAAMVRRFMESRALTGYALREGDLIAGYSFYVYEGQKGLIGDIFVSQSFRNGITEVQLLMHVLETLQATPGIRRVEAQLLNLDGPAIREFLSSQGFQSYDRKFLFLSLADVRPFSVAECHPMELKPWDGRRFQDAAELITRAYHGHVDGAVSDQYRTPAGAARFLENVTRYPGCGPFQPDSSLLAFHPGTATLCGMLLTSAVSDGVAHITQLCVAPELQGQGIGLRMVLYALERLREQGFQAVTLTVTVANTRAIRLYERLGFTTLAVFPACAWETAAPHLGLAEKKTTIRM